MLSTAELCELPLKWGTQKGCMEERVRADDRSILGSRLCQLLEVEVCWVVIYIDPYWSDMLG